MITRRDFLGRSALTLFLLTQLVTISAAKMSSLQNVCVSVDEENGSGFSIAGSDGTFTISSGLIADNCTIQTHHQLYVSRTHSATVMAGTEPNLGGTELNVSGSIQGVVISSSGNPVSGIDVQCLNESRNNTVYFAVTLGEDSFFFDTAIKNGTYTVQPNVPPSRGFTIVPLTENTQHLALAVASGSMCMLPSPYCDGWSHPFSPTLHVGDLIIAQIANISDIHAAPYPDGDIVVFQQLYGDELIVHRAIEKRVQDGNIYLITKGDGNSGPDQPVPASHVIGKVILRIPWVGHIALFMRKLID